MTSPALRQDVGLPTARQRVLVLLVLTNAHGRALHPIFQLHQALGGMVPMQTMWNILSRLASSHMIRFVGTDDRRAGVALMPDPHEVAKVLREIETERTRKLRAHETNLMQDAERLGLKLPFRVLYQPPPVGVPDGHSGDGDHGTEEGQR